MLRAGGGEMQVCLLPTVLAVVRLVPNHHHFIPNASGEVSVVSKRSSVASGAVSTVTTAQGSIIIINYNNFN